jgi:protein-L-isoaspartate(D-aspartate) O-methyltransferase
MADERRRLGEILATQIADARVLRAFGAVRRELFVPPELHDRAYENGALPIGCAQTISQPLVVARMTEVLALEGGERVLDVGTGSGYHAAVLALMEARVVTIERIPALAARALRALDAAGLRDVVCLVGDATAMRSGADAFDAINVAAAAARPQIERIARLLAPGGRLVAPLRRRGRQHLVLVQRPAGGGDDSWLELEPVRFVPLVGGES